MANGAASGLAWCHVACGCHVRVMCVPWPFQFHVPCSSCSCSWFMIMIHDHAHIHGRSCSWLPMFMVSELHLLFLVHVHVHVYMFMHVTRQGGCAASLMCDRYLTKRRGCWQLPHFRKNPASTRISESGRCVLEIPCSPLHS